MCTSGVGGDDSDIIVSWWWWWWFFFTVALHALCVANANSYTAHRINNIALNFTRNNNYYYHHRFVLYAWYCFTFYFIIVIPSVVLNVIKEKKKKLRSSLGNLPNTSITIEKNTAMIFFDKVIYYVFAI